MPCRWSSNTLSLNLVVNHPPGIRVGLYLLVFLFVWLFFVCLVAQLHMLWAKHGLRLQKITLSIGSVWWIIGYFSLFDCWFKGFLLLIEFNWNIFSSQFCFLRPGSVVVNHSPTRSTTKSLGPRPLSVFFLILGDPTVATHHPAERHHKTNLPRTSLIHTQIRITEHKMTNWWNLFVRIFWKLGKFVLEKIWSICLSRDLALNSWGEKEVLVEAPGIFTTSLFVENQSRASVLWKPI